MTPDDTGKPSDEKRAGEKRAGEKLSHPNGDEFSIFAAEPPKRARMAARHILFAGVAGACVLGVGLGLWARPGMAERQAAAKPQPAAPAAEPAARSLQIVVTDRPAPIGAPIEVLPGTAAKASAPAAATPLVIPKPVEPDPVAPSAPPVGVMRVKDSHPAPPKTAPSLALAPWVVAAVAEGKSLEARLTAPRHQVAPAQVAPAKFAKAEAAPAKPVRKAPVHVGPVRMAQAPRPPVHAAPPKPDHRLELARAAAAAKAVALQKAAAHRIELAEAAQAAKAAKTAKVQQQLAAKAEKLRLAKAEKAEQVHLAQAHRAETIRLAQAEAKGRAEARAQARTEALAEAREETRKQIRLASLVRVLRKALPHPAAHETRRVQTAKLDRKHRTAHQAVVERASLKSHRAPPRAAAPLAPPPRPSGLMKVSAPRCASRDPGEALVCADPALGAADRQMSRAYQGARAAGVPDAELARQQQHWLTARASAAREAPWAVHDVYLARIAELNGQAKQAHGDGY